MWSFTACSHRKLIQEVSHFSRIKFLAVPLNDPSSFLTSSPTVLSPVFHKGRIFVSLVYHSSPRTWNTAWQIVSTQKLFWNEHWLNLIFWDISGVIECWSVFLERPFGRSGRKIHNGERIKDTWLIDMKFDHLRSVDGGGPIFWFWKDSFVQRILILYDFLFIYRNNRKISYISPSVILLEYFVSTEYR